MKSRKETLEKLIERDGLRCAISGEAVSSADELSISHILPKDNGGSDELDNLILIKNSLNHSLSNNEMKSAHLLIKELKNRQDELTYREKESFKREQNYRNQIESQKAELEMFRQKLQKDSAERSAIFEKELNEEKHRLQEQSLQLQSQLKAREAALHEQMQMIEEQRRKLTHETLEKERQLSLAFEDLEKEKAKYREESRRKIESKSGAYVNEALVSLESTSKKYHDTARNWSIAGFVSLTAGVITALVFGIMGLTPLEGQDSIEWTQVVFFAFKGLIAVGLFVALAKYSFTYGQSFMHESLKSSERKHAINFGKFYLESYGADADWSQVKEAFEHWNINATSAFSNNDADKFDPKIIERAANLIDSIGKINTRQSQEPSSGTKP